MAEHSGQSDQVTQIKLPSTIEQVVWSQQKAAASGEVFLNIFTHYVGNNSDIEIELSDQSGKKYDTLKSKISGNHFSSPIEIPRKAEKILYATAKLPRHGLELKSNPLLILPPIEITNLKWDKKEARRGDLLKLTANVKGVQNGSEAEIEIWEYDSDSAHDYITKLPVFVENSKIEAEWEFEYHEDTDDIPSAEETEKGYNPPEYFFRVKLGGVFEDSGLLEFKDWIEIELIDDTTAEPMEQEEYIIVLPDGKELKGKLDENGLAKINDIPPGKFKVIYPNLGEVDFIE